MKSGLTRLPVSSLSPRLLSFLSAAATVIIKSTDSPSPSPADGSNASPIGSPDRASSAIQGQPSDDDMSNRLGLAISPRISNKKLLSRLP